MAKNKQTEFLYKIEGLKRMVKRKQLRQRKNTIKQLQKQNLQNLDKEMDWLDW